MIKDKMIQEQISRCKKKKHEKNDNLLICNDQR